MRGYGSAAAGSSLRCLVARWSGAILLIGCGLRTQAFSVGNSVSRRRRPSRQWSGGAVVLKPGTYRKIAVAASTTTTTLSSNLDVNLDSLSRAAFDMFQLFEDSNYNLQTLPSIVSQVAERNGAVSTSIVTLAASSVVYTVASTLLLPLLFRFRPLVSNAILDKLLADTFLQSSSNVECVYKATRDGFSALDFHNKVDDLGSALLVCRSRSGVTLGGYNPSGWRSTDDYYSSTTAFLWAIPAPWSSGNGNNTVRKYPIRRGGGGNTAVFDYATGGPCFGTSDLQLGPPQAAVMGGFAGPDMENLSMNAGDLRRGLSTTAGFSYETDQQWPLRGSFAIVDVEVYCVKR